MRPPRPARAAIDALIFDLDGTLVDTLKDLALAVNHTLVANGLPPHPIDAYRRFIGEGTRHLVKSALPPTHGGLTDALVAQFRTYYEAHLLDHSAVYPGVAELVNELSRRGLPMCVLSNKLDALTQRMVRALFPEVPFVRVAGERHGVPRKPDPTSALELLAVMGGRAARCALIGDSRFDMLAARAAGMRAIGVAWGLGDRTELETAGCNTLIERPEQLLDFTA